MPEPERLRQLAAAPDPRAGFTSYVFLSPGDEGVTDLLLIRHGQIAATTTEDDLHLTDLGREQADLLARYLAREPLHALYSSPTARARETAEAIGRFHGLAIEQVEALHDIRQLKPMDRPMPDLIAELYGADAVPEVLERLRSERRFETMAPYIEPGAGFRARVVAALDAIVERHPGQRVAVVTHGPVIMTYAAHVLASAQDLPFNPRLTGITRILARGTHRTLDCVNATPHFEPGVG